MQLIFACGLNSTKLTLTLPLFLFFRSNSFACIFVTGYRYVAELASYLRGLKLCYQQMCKSAQAAQKKYCKLLLHSTPYCSLYARTCAVWGCLTFRQNIYDRFSEIPKFGVAITMLSRSCIDLGNFVFGLN